MSFRPASRAVTFGGYALFNGCLALIWVSAAGEIAHLSVALSPSLATVAAADVSRVEKFKQAEAAAAEAPQVPVPRLVIADSAPDVPVQVLAVRLDEAEALKISPIELNPKPVRSAKANLRGGKLAKAKVQAKLQQAKVARAALRAKARAGKLPPSVVEFALKEIGTEAKATKKRPVVVETSRDIVNRSLGVLVALKN